jgi:hypothetical protein
MNTTNIEIDEVHGAEKQKKEGVRKDSGITKNKKKPSVPRATPRPYKNLTNERLVATMDTLKERVEVTDNRLQTYNIRLRKLNVENEARKKDMEKEKEEDME